MYTITTKINKINLKKKYLELICENIIFYIEINQGSMNIKIKNTDNEDVGYTYLDKNDIIKVSYEKINKIKIAKKIYINTKYTLNSESTDSETI